MKHFYYPSGTIACGLNFDDVPGYELAELREDVDCPRCRLALQRTAITCPGCIGKGPHMCDPKRPTVGTVSPQPSYTLAEFLATYLQLATLFREHRVRKRLSTVMTGEEWWEAFFSWLKEKVS